MKLLEPFRQKSQMLIPSNSAHCSLNMLQIEHTQIIMDAGNALCSACIADTSVKCFILTH